jgi:hypothetical protein
MKARTRTVAGVALAALVACGAAAADKAYEREVEGRIELARATLASRGWALEQVFTGTLATGGVGRAALNFEPGREYRLVGRCDGDCKSLDLVLTRDEQAIDQDADHDKLPDVEYLARHRGNFRAQAQMVECRAATCRYGIAVFSR